MNIFLFELKCNTTETFNIFSLPERLKNMKVQIKRF